MTPLTQSARLSAVMVRPLTFGLGWLGVTLLLGCGASDGAGSAGIGGVSAAGTGASDASGGANAGANAGGANAGGANAGGVNAGGVNAGGVNAGGASDASGGASAGGSGQGGGGASGPVGPRFIGRFDTTNPAAPVFEWSGSAISLRFRGTAIGVTLSDGDGDVFEVVLDGKHTVLTTMGGSHKYALGSGLSDGPHDLLLYRRSEAFFGDTTFGGFDLDPSAYLPGAPVPTHRLEVIGDSISAGYGDEGTNPCQFVAATENQYLSYEALAARSVGAELYTEAWSGIGMIRNTGGDTVNPTMPQRYPRTLPAKDTTATWDFSAFVPDAVVINLGTNDFSTGDPGVAFQSAYTTFVTMLRGHYPNARLYLAVGPMLGGGQYDQAKGYLNGVIAARSGAGDKNLALLELGTQNGAVDGLGCDSHPSLATHQKLSLKLVAALEADLGW